MPCYEIDGLRPVVHPTAFVHPDAVLIGDVIVGPRCYIAPLAGLRGDFGRIILEEGCNVQDTCVMHGFPGTDTVVEVDGHIGHGAVLHGCRVGRNALVGMGAVILDDAAIGESAFVAAGALVKTGMSVPPRVLVAGMPARIVRELTEQEIAWKSRGTRCYQDLAVRSLTTLKPCQPLTEVEADRRRFGLAGMRNPMYGGARGPRG
ncbi:phenylacetic acid degradation protein PaaY [Castellaniella defragrans]|uniref:Phenylacetic acid degradation protein n=1 Tax=Castellaniella defragrans TaxID=75697 RepID=A0A7W9WLF3_CASDE|nr:phenylacetic acid degradation protein PaaY [Castellaniella defragrans]KAB0611651.1 phenylacetic acid degradation protein PaaY [Castellaniella defragrans]MBB6083227.1 phenylacetic acid degradation protein [Castellaniella defragrans]